ncbi:hypothetical protein LIER_36612 [Lithospermum erythrorhizon]|uniref:Uncharacterized protein n=1 Tax=Lithospermum erythrorhizon TaxID=34254 RepID=A0AAV3PCB0_LITER
MQGESVPGEIDQSSGTDGWKDDIDAFCNKYGFYQDDVNTIECGKLIENPVSEGKGKECTRSSSTRANANNSGIKEHGREGNLFSLLLSSPLALGSREPMIGLIEVERSDWKKISINQILRLAGKCFIDQKTSNEPVNDTNGVADDKMSTDDKQDVELVLHLLDAAEKISKKQFDEASNLIATHGRDSLASK